MPILALMSRQFTSQTSRSHRSSRRGVERKKALCLCLVLAGAGALFSIGYRTSPALAQASGPSSFEIQTTAFKPGGDIPRKFTCAGQNVSPALRWTEPPAGTASFALIMDDPDAPMSTWVHWIAYDLPAGTRQLSEGVPKGDGLQGGGRQGRNDFPEVGYGGPCPPPGKPHRYYFKLYALDKKLDLKAGATKHEVEQAMKGHVLAKAELMGRYGR